MPTLSRSTGHTIRIGWAAVVGAGLLAASSRAQETPADAQLLQRTATYVQHFVDNLANVVAREEYRQQFRNAAGRRRLTSEFLLVQQPGEKNIYLTFRDVIAVNGRPVSDQPERLAKLFLEPFASAIRRAAEIKRESVRHGLEQGRLMDPLDVIAYLQGFYQKQFRFTVRGVEPGLGANVRRVEIRQIVEPNVRGIEAEAWIDEQTGRVAKTQLRQGRAPNARLTTTTFAVDPGLRIAVPIEMRDEVPYLQNDEFTGVATYSQFRRFEVRTEETVTTPSQR